MSEIRRLLDEDATLRERALLRAASSDRPTDAKARERTLAALGLAASVGGVATVAQVKGAAKAVGLVQKLAGVSLFKWSVVVLSVAAVTTGILATKSGPLLPTSTSRAATNGVLNGVPNPASGALPFAPSTPSTPVTPATPATPVTPAPAHERAASPEGTSKREGREHGSDSAEPAADPRPTGRTASPIPAPAHSENPSRDVSKLTPNPDIPGPVATDSPSALPPIAAPTASSSDPLSEQVVVLDRGRALLAAGDGAGCLRAINDFRRRFPRGALAPEATVLEVRARLAKGDRVGASAVAHTFAEENPKSPYRTRILEIVAAP